LVGHQIFWAVNVYKEKCYSICAINRLLGTETGAIFPEVRFFHVLWSLSHTLSFCFSCLVLFVCLFAVSHTNIFPQIYFFPQIYLSPQTECSKDQNLKTGVITSTKSLT
jgi:hypothetical protein